MRNQDLFLDFLMLSYKVKPNCIDWMRVLQSRRVYLMFILKRISRYLGWMIFKVFYNLEYL